MKLDIIVLDKSIQKFQKSTKKNAKRLARVLRRKGAIDIYLISGKRMQMLNRRFRGKNRSTNVLSFQKPKGFPGIKLGEVYLDPLYIEKHKEAPNLMLVHGVLHILGYDHEKKNDRIRMERREKQLLERLNG